MPLTIVVTKKREAYFNQRGAIKETGRFAEFVGDHAGHRIARTEQ